MDTTAIENQAIRKIKPNQGSDNGKKDWVECTLGEVCEVNMGQSPPSSTYNTDGVGLPFFQGKAEFSELHPVVKKWCSVPKRIANKNDILLSVRAPVGSTNIADQKSAIGRGLAAITYKYNYLFIWFYLKSIESNLDNQGTGTTFKAISGSILKAQKIFLPPLPIQRAIVKKIEELFSSLERGIADLKKAQEQLVIYRQAVLKKAFEGELTKEWRCKNGIKYSGKYVALSEVADSCLGKMLDKSKNKGTLKPYLGNINVRWGTFDIINLKTMRFEDSEHSRYQLLKGDLVICEGGEPGRCAVWERDEPGFIQKALHRVRFYGDSIPNYFYYYFFYQAKTGGLNPYFTGTTIKHLTGRKLKEFKVPLCSKQEQHAIVREIESRLSVCDKVEESITESLEKAQALRQSILKKAFEGKLLSGAEIEQCKQEQDYEPASVLLERIKKEKKK